jgi:prolyl 4-hydroxylase
MRKELVDWILKVKETHTLKQTYEYLLKTGYVKNNMVEELSEVYGTIEVISFFNSLEEPNTIPYPDVKLNNSNTVIIDGRVCRVLFELKLPRVVMIDNFLSTMECQQLISMAEPKLNRSSVVDKESVGKSKIDLVRTSSGMFFHKQENHLISEIENRVAHFTNWPVSNHEAFQVLKYEPGQEYKPHNDYFDTTTEAGRVITKRGGQRVGTVILYLNNCPEGGGTIFPESGLELKPAKGCAVFFGYPTHNKESKTLHGGSPVIKGEKWIAVKWLRQDKFV